MQPQNTCGVHLNGELPEWLMEQFAKLSTSNCRVGSNPTLSADIVMVLNCLLSKLNDLKVTPRGVA